MDFKCENNATTIHKDDFVNFTLIKCGHFNLPVRVGFPPSEHDQKMHTVLLVITNILSCVIATFGNLLVLITIKNSTVLRGLLTH